jgi:hypothetical protein
MRTLIVHSNFLGQDLYHGTPDVRDAKVVDVKTSVVDDYYSTALKLELKNGLFMVIDIRQER